MNTRNLQYSLLGFNIYFKQGSIVLGQINFKKHLDLWSLGNQRVKYSIYISLITGLSRILRKLSTCWKCYKIENNLYYRQLLASAVSLYTCKQRPVMYMMSSLQNRWEKLQWRQHWILRLFMVN